MKFQCTCSSRYQWFPLDEKIVVWISGQPREVYPKFRKFLVTEMSYRNFRLNGSHFGYSAIFEFFGNSQGSFCTTCLSFQVSEFLVKWRVPIVISVLTGHDWDDDGEEETTVFKFILLWLIWNCVLCLLESSCISSSQMLLLSRCTLQEIRNGSLALMDISGSERICVCLRMYVRFFFFCFFFLLVECICGLSLLWALTENPGFPPSTKPNISKFQFDQDRGPAWKPGKADVASSIIIAIFYIHMKLNAYSTWLKPKCPCPKLLERLAQIKSKPSKLINIVSMHGYATYF